MQLGVLERLGRGRLMLARRFFEVAGRPGAYTRTRGLDRVHQKELLVQHLRRRAPRGVPFQELAEVLPGLSRSQLQGLLQELRAEQRIGLSGERKGSSWHALGEGENVIPGRSKQT